MVAGAAEARCDGGDGALHGVIQRLRSGIARGQELRVVEKRDCGRRPAMTSRSKFLGNIDAGDRVAGRTACMAAVRFSARSQRNAGCGAIDCRSQEVGVRSASTTTV